MRADMIVLVLSLAVAVVKGGTGELDLSELNSVQYSVQILDTPVAEDAVSDADPDTHTQTMMVNKAGQKYQCSVPLVPDQDDEQAARHETAAPDIPALLAPLETGPCLYKTKDWWTYEVCYKRSIKQYHVENEKPVGLVLVLGLHDAARDNWEQSNATYQPQWYSNGSRCDLTGQPRNTELRFVCNEAAVQEFIGDIFEPQSCEYTIVVHTSQLCSVPWLRPVSEPTPLPITCSPVLSAVQLERWQHYQQRRALAERLATRDRQAKRAAELSSKLGANQVAAGGENLAGLLDSLGDHVAENLVSEIHTMLDKAISGDAAAAGMKVIDLRDKEATLAESDSEAKEEEDGNEAKAGDGNWDVIHQKHRKIGDDELRTLVAERNEVWRKMFEAKKLVKKLSSQLHDTETFIEKEKGEKGTEKKIHLLTLEHQKKSIEKALGQARELVSALEMGSKDIGHKIVQAQSRLMHSEASLWTVKMKMLGAMMKNGARVEDFKTALLDMAKDYRKVTNERLTRIDDYFKVAKKIIGDAMDKEYMEKIQKFMQFADGELLNIAEMEFETEQDININDTPKASTNPKTSSKSSPPSAKVKDAVNKEMRHKFDDIFEEVSDEMDISDGEIDKEEVMAVMSKTLDELMSKLSGTGDKIDNVQKHIENFKKSKSIIDESASDDAESLKRDNKQSIKKDLSRIEIMEEEEEEDDEEDKEDEEDEEFKRATKLLKEASAEVDALEKELKREMEKESTPTTTETTLKTTPFPDKATDGLDNLKVSVTNLSPGGASEVDAAQADKIVKKLEGTIREKLSKMGLDTGGRPIEVKLITTQVPEGLVEDGDASDDPQMQGMFYNMMTGNQKGYEDINSQRKVETNYKFNWSEEMVDDIEKKIHEYGGEEDIEEKDESAEMTESEPILDIFEGGDERTRPSAHESRISTGEQSSDESGDDISKREEL